MGGERKENNRSIKVSTVQEEGGKGGGGGTRKGWEKRRICRKKKVRKDYREKWRKRNRKK